MYAQVASNIRDVTDKKNEHPHIVVDEASSFSMKAGDTEEVSVEDVSAQSLQEVKVPSEDDGGYQRLDGSQRSHSALERVDQVENIDTPQQTYIGNSEQRARKGRKTPNHLTPNKGRLSDSNGSQAAPVSQYYAGSSHM